MTAEKVPYLLANYGLSAPRHANMQKGHYCVHRVTVHALLHYRGKVGSWREGAYALLDGSRRERLLSCGVQL